MPELDATQRLVKAARNVVCELDSIRNRWESGPKMRVHVDTHRELNDTLLALDRGRVRANAEIAREIVGECEYDHRQTAPCQINYGADHCAPCLLATSVIAALDAKDREVGARLAAADPPPDPPPDKDPSEVVKSG